MNRTHHSLLNVLIMVIALCISMIGAVAAMAEEQVMDFEGVSSGTAVSEGDRYVEDGMIVTVHNAYDNPGIEGGEWMAQIGNPLSGPSGSTDNGLYFHGNTAGEFGRAAGHGAYMRFELENGGEFSLMSFDLATNQFVNRELVTSADPAIRITLSNTPETYETLFFDDNTYPLIKNITWFEIHTVWYATEVDNITIDRNGNYAPDMIVSSVDTSELYSDCQLLEVSGTIHAEIANIGETAAVNAFSVVFFEDADFDGVFDPKIDNILGEALQSPLAAGDSVTLSSPVHGTVAFQGNIIYALVDCDNTVREADETNNYAHSGQDCQTTPVIGGFDPVVEWNKNSFSDKPESNQVMMTPVVGDLNGDGIPDIVFSTFTDYQEDLEHGVGEALRAISGVDGSELWNIPETEFHVESFAGLAIGDTDLDGRPEIIAVHNSCTELICFEDDGTFKWKSEVCAGGVLWGSASIADLDADGVPEIILGSTVLNADGTIRWNGRDVGGIGMGSNRFGPLSTVADLDMDGSPEVVAGCSAFHADGSLYWNASISDGFPGVANFDDDPFPEIVAVSNGGVYLLEHDGSVKWGVVHPGGGYGGPPTIADVDNDNMPEIGVAGYNSYVVFETDGSIKWQQTTNDGSNVTGSSVFDFEGDGQAEIIYGDQEHLRIYRGTDGEELYRLAKGSGTTTEYPLVVDVDADGNAEIVSVANLHGQNGIYVIGDANDAWVNTRQIWNQHTYHITNVNDDGTIPIYEESNWEAYNSFRQNIQTEGSMFAAPDLTASFIEFVCNDDPSMIGIVARIGNGGSIVAAAPIKAAFYDGYPDLGGICLGCAETTQNLEPGQFEDVALVISSQLTGLHTICVVADDDGNAKGAIRESNEDNNQCCSVFNRR